MRLFDQRSSALLLLFTLPLLFFPKINLIKFGGIETAGVRVDDFILIALTLVVFWAHFAIRKPLLQIEKIMLAIFSLSIISFAANRFLVADGQLHVDAKIHYAMRIFEYFIFFYVGLLLGGPKRLRDVLYCFLAFNGTLMILQKFGIVGQFSNFGYVTSSSGRVMGVGSFPSEMGAVLNLVFCYLIFDPHPRTKLVSVLPPTIRVFIGKTYLFWLFAIFAVLTFLTGSRIAIAALGLIFVVRCFQVMKQRSLGATLLALMCLAFGTGIFTVAATNSRDFNERSAGLFSTKNIVLAQEVWKAIDTHYDPNGHEVVKYTKSQNDMSWWIRIHKWCYAFKIYYEHPQCYLQGIGPGFASAGLDGGFLRLFVEYGIVGFGLFMLLFYKIGRQSEQLKWMVIAFLLNMIFFDVFLAYKPMSLLFLTSGANRHPLKRRSADLNFDSMLIHK